MKVAFLTLGCKVNSYETEKMKQQFEDRGHMVVSFEEKADVYIINTCTVTNIADRKSRKMLHRAKRLNPDSIVAATGCYVDSAEKKGEKDTSVDIFIPNSKKDDIADIIINEYSMKTNNDITDDATLPKMSETAMKEEHTRAYLKVQNGCNQYCTYCIIPYVRGPLTSKSTGQVVNEVKQLANKGIKEVVITGIHLSSYGVDSNKSGSFLELEGRPLLELLEAVSEVKGIERIRLGSLEPRIITEKFAERLSKIKGICPHFHLSLQSGCDTVLKRMNRHYTSQDYLERTEILRKYFVNPAVTTDIIVGFPQETEEEFAATCEFAKKVGFAQIHVFKYSRRQGTIADSMDGQITETVKSERSERLISIEKQLEEKYQKESVKEIEDVLFEESTLIEGKKYITGYNERYVRIAVACDDNKDMESLCNTIKSVRITGQLTTDIMLGEILD